MSAVFSCFRIDWLCNRRYTTEERKERCIIIRKPKLKSRQNISLFLDFPLSFPRNIVAVIRCDVTLSSIGSSAPG